MSTVLVQARTRCKVCLSAVTDEVNRLLNSGESAKRIAAAFPGFFSRATVRRHKVHCLALVNAAVEAVVQAQVPVETQDPETFDIFAQMLALQQRTTRALNASELAGTHRTTFKGVDTALALLRLWGAISVELQRQRDAKPAAQTEDRASWLEAGERVYGSDNGG